jgi:methyl-accepting chemotaxis protein
MNFNALRLSSRLFLAFGIVVLLSVLSSGFALLKLQSNQHSLETIVLDNNVRLALNQQMSESIHVVSRVTRTVVLLDDIGEKREQEKKVAAARESYNKAHADLARFPASEAGKALRAEVDSAAAKARELNTVSSPWAWTGRRSKRPHC